MAANVVVNFIGDSKSFDKASRNVNSGLGKINKASSALMTGLATLGAAAASAGVAVGGLALKEFANFDDAMVQSTAIMGNLSDDMKGKMSDAAREVGKTTLVSATQAAEGYFFLASAGLDAEQSIAALPQVAAFAQAGMFDMALATDLATDAQSALGLTVKDAGKNLENLTRVTDVLVKANTLANATVEQFSTALTNKSGPALRSVGKTIEEGTAILAAFADQGVKGEEAGTQLAIVLRDLQTKAIKKADAFKQMGVSVFNAEGNMNNMADILGDLEGALGGLSDAGKKSALLDLGFTDKSIGGLMTLLGTSDKIRGFQQELEKAGGTAQEVADKQLESFKAQMELIKSRVTDVLIEIGSRLAPVVLATFDKIEAFWSEHGTQIKAIATNISNNVVAVFQEYWPKIREVVSDVVGWITNFWEENGQSIMSKAEEIGQSVQKSMGEIWPDIKAAIDEFFASFQVITSEALIIIGVLWDVFGETILGIVKTSMNLVIGIFRGLFSIVEGMFLVFSGVLTGDMGKLGDGLEKIAGGIAQVIKSIFGALWGTIKAIFQLGKNVVIQIFKSLWNAIKSLVSGGINEVKGGFSSLVGSLRSLGGRFASAGRHLGSSIINGIKSGLGKVVGIAGSFAGAVVRAVKGAINRGVIGPINRALNFSINIPGLGRKSINAPDIPRLARGGYMTTPTQAIVGDSPGEGEIVSPVSMMEKVVRENSGGGKGIEIGTINMNTNATPGELVRELTFAMRANGI